MFLIVAALIFCCICTVCIRSDDGNKNTPKNSGNNNELLICSRTLIIEWIDSCLPLKHALDIVDYMVGKLFMTFK